MIDEQLFQFRFRVNKSFLGRGHAITIPQHHKTAVLTNVGSLYRSQRAIEIVSATGQGLEGTIRHSVNNGGEYLQLNCSDQEIIRDLSLGQYINVELRRNRSGLSFQLDPPPVDVD